MRHKIAVLLASLGATAALTTALVSAGFLPQDPTRPSTPTAAAVPDSASADAPIQVDTVYLPPPAEQQTITIHRSVRGGEHEHEDEGEADD